MNIQNIIEERFKAQKEYLGTNKPINKIKPLVSVYTLVYMHEPYIRQCLDGLIMQKTDFTVEFIIGEDGSADKSAEICKEYAEKYPDKIRLFLRDRNISHYQDENDNDIMLNAELCKMSCRGKYIAICEGDDYWTDENKLTKEYNIIKTGKYGLVYTGFKRIDINGNIIESTKKLEIQIRKCHSGHIFYNMVKSNFIQTLTVMYDKELLSDIYKYYDHIYDYPTYLHLSGKANVYYINEITGCYRINPKGMMATNYLKFDQNGKHTLSNAFMAYLSHAYVNLTLKEKILFFIRSIYRLLFLDIDCKKEIVHKLTNKS
jgi:glycosyltransferase involved in cell wall biosynthesis